MYTDSNWKTTHLNDQKWQTQAHPSLHPYAVCHTQCGSMAATEWQFCYGAAIGVSTKEQPTDGSNELQ